MKNSRSDTHLIMGSDTLQYPAPILDTIFSIAYNEKGTRMAENPGIAARRRKGRRVYAYGHGAGGRTHARGSRRRHHPDRTGQRRQHAFPAGIGAGYFPMYNRNKRSLCVDLKSEGGKGAGNETDRQVPTS